MKLREGFTTGSASTAAIVAALNVLYKGRVYSFVSIKIPVGLLKIQVNSLFYSNNFCISSVIKDGGDDPDCTHGIEIIAKVSKNKKEEWLKNAHELKLSDKFYFFCGKGIGLVTKDGLSVKVGEPAINPMPRKMIKENVELFLVENNVLDKPYIILEVPKGYEVAKHTLNERLGILGGISILGTTGIVKPISMDAYTATIDLSLNIAKKKKFKDIVLSFGRQSELGAKKILNFHEDAFIIIGDFFRYGVEKAKEMGFNVTLAGQPGKILKASMDYDNTNVKFGEFSMEKTLQFLSPFCNSKELEKISHAKTARHLAEIIQKNNIKLWDKIAEYLGKKERISVLIFSYEGDLIGRS